MTHDELLEDIDEARKSYGLKWDNGSPYLDALRAVVELHKPDPDYNDCAQCGDITDNTGGALATPYPCPTIQAIEKELA